MAILTVETTVKVPAKKAWELWTNPKHIKNWYFASDDWHAPYADNNICVNGLFKTTMSSKDNSISFDFEGVYTIVEKYEAIHYTISGDDGRNVIVLFLEDGNTTKITESFESENENPLELQKQGWQAILNNFKRYAEGQ